MSKDYTESVFSCSYTNPHVRKLANCALLIF